MAAHPGNSDTELSRYLPKWAMLISPIIIPFFTHKPAKGALPMLRAALDTFAVGGDYYGPNHPREYKGPPVKVKPRRKAMDKALAQQLWSVSEALTNCKYNL